jgi:hypothetical protein
MAGGASCCASRKGWGRRSGGARASLPRQVEGGGSAGGERKEGWARCIRDAVAAARGMGRSRTQGASHGGRLSVGGRCWRVQRWPARLRRVDSGRSCSCFVSTNHRDGTTRRGKHRTMGYTVLGTPQSDVVQWMMYEAPDTGGRFGQAGAATLRWNVDRSELCTGSWGARREPRNEGLGHGNQGIVGEGSLSLGEAWWSSLLRVEDHGGSTKKGNNANKAGVDSMMQTGKDGWQPRRSTCAPVLLMLLDWHTEAETSRRGSRAVSTTDRTAGRLGIQPHQTPWRLQPGGVPFRQSPWTQAKTGQGDHSTSTPSASTSASPCGRQFPAAPWSTSHGALDSCTCTQRATSGPGTDASLPAQQRGLARCQRRRGERAKGCWLSR